MTTPAPLATKPLAGPLLFVRTPIRPTSSATAGRPITKRSSNTARPVSSMRVSCNWPRHSRARGPISN